MLYLCKQAGYVRKRPVSKVPTSLFAAFSF